MIHFQSLTRLCIVQQYVRSLLPDSVLEYNEYNGFFGSMVYEHSVFFLLVLEQGWTSRCPLDMAWCNIFLNELKEWLAPCDSTVCQAQITQWVERQCCRFLLLSLTLTPTASLNTPRCSPFSPLDTSKIPHLNMCKMVIEIFERQTV